MRKSFYTLISVVKDLMGQDVRNGDVFFHYDHGSRAQKVVIPLLKDFRGALQTDGYDVYKMYEEKKGVLPLGCWVHAGRRFEEALKENKVRAEYALAQIGMLYDVERRANEEALSFEERSDLRCRLSYSIMVAFEKWLVNEYPKVLPKGRMGIRPLALGRKNYLFCGYDDAAETAAVIYSLMGCCKASHVNFREWFVYVLENYT